MADDVTLTVGGAVHGGWTQVTARRSIETIAGAFEIGVTERWPGQQAARAIALGDACSLALGGDTVITGYVDEVSPAIEGDSHSVSLRGRDATGDLVDCSAERAGGEWINVLLARIVADLAQPFGIQVTVATDLGRPFKKFAIEQGETAYEAIERACRQRAVLPISDGLGGLALTNSGAEGAATALIEGENILSARGTYSLLDRYSAYTVKGQATGSDLGWGASVSEPQGKASDPGVHRHRPLVIAAEAPGDAAQLTERAKWEARVRAARARRADITVQGWRDGAGKLWRPNTEVPVTSPSLGIDARMLITGVQYTLSGQGGSRAILTLARRQAFELIEIEEKPDKGLGWP